MSRARPYSVLPAIALLVLGPAGCEDTVAPENAVISEPFQVEGDAAGRTVLALTGVNGNITVTGGSVEDAYVATGFRRVRNCSESDAEAWIDRLEVRVTGVADTIVIETVQPPSTSPCTLEVEYEVRVPSRLEARVVDVNGNVVVTDVAGGVAVTAVNGNVLLDGSEGPATVRLTNGNVQADVLIAGAETVDLLTVNGNVGAVIPTDTDAGLSASVVNGTISVANLAISNQVRTSTRLTGTLGAGEGTIVLQTTNGNIAITGT